MRITAIESFTVQVPISEEDKAQGKLWSAPITRVETDEGAVGYCGGRGASEEDLAGALRPMLIGEDPTVIERHLAKGLDRWPAVEHALWDLIGKAAGEPLYKLWGGHKDRVPVYLTSVWLGNPDQSDRTPEEQASHIARFAELGFKAVKFRSWRPDPMEDVEVCRQIRRMVGGRDRMEIMIDRTAQYSGSVWDYETGLRVALALQEQDVTWLEEPFHRSDVFDSARLAAEVDILITGGEGDHGLARFVTYLAHRSFDIIQPDAYTSGGLWTLRKIMALAEAFDTPCIPHGSGGLSLAGTLQVVASSPNTRIEEVVFTHPPLTPAEMWEPLQALTHGRPPFAFEDGAIMMSDLPGLGLDLDEEALEEYRVGRRA